MSLGCRVTSCWHLADLAIEKNILLLLIVVVVVVVVFWRQWIEATLRLELSGLDSHLLFVLSDRILLSFGFHQDLRVLFKQELLLGPHSLIEGFNLFFQDDWELFTDLR